MKPSSVCLPKSEIPLLLSGDLPPDEAAAAESHIAECQSCRSVIESMIADSRWWDDARKSLVASATRSPFQVEVTHDTEPATTSKLLDLLGPTDDPNMLGRIGPYEIIGLLGQGGMGAVFKGFDRSLNRFVAIKMLLPHLAASGAARKRFAREGQAVAAVVDDHVMAIHCVDEWQGVPYLVMTYSRGVSLQKRLSDNGPLEVREILRIGMQAAKGLAAAHAQGIVHRDIKPANIFLDQNVERVQLMDFGLARAVDDASLTRSGTLAGTPQYMSPEQARAETVDYRSDLFSLGSVMYAMCTGHAPFRAESSYSVLRLITDKEPRPIREINPEIPVWLCAIISKLMAKHAGERFDTAQEVAGLLEDCLAHVQQPTSASLPASLVRQTTKRKSIFNATGKRVLTMLGFLGMTFLGLVIWSGQDQETARATPAVVTAAELEKQIQLAGHELFYGRMELGQEFKTVVLTKDKKRENVTATGTARWLKKGGMTRIESDRMVPEIIKATELQAEKWTTGQDEGRAYAWNRTTGRISYGALRPGSLAYAPNLLFWGRSGITFPQPMFGPNPTITSITRDGRNEIDVDVVATPQSNVSLRYVGISPSRGYLPTRVETRIGDRLKSQVEFHNFFEPRPGVWAAKTILWTDWSDENDGEGNPILASRTRFVVTRLELGDDAKIQDEEFKLNLPDNIKVVDGTEIEAPGVPQTESQYSKPLHAGEATIAERDAGIANLTSLLERQRAREKAVRQLSMVGNIYQSQQIATEHHEGESNEEYIKRYTSQEVNYDGLGPFPMTILRDYTADLGQIKFGDLNGKMPILFREWFFKGDVFTQLMGVEQGHCQATITRKPAEELRQPWSGWIRADVYAFRPIRDHELSTVLDKAAHTPGIPDPGGRPLFHLKKKESADHKTQWIATFLHQEPSEVNGRAAVEQLWYRVFWEQVDKELLITRVDELSVVGGADSMPARVALVDDYRKVNGVSMPHRVRTFMFFNPAGMLGAEFVASEVKVNDAVVLPTQLQIPAGTSVRDELTGKKYRQPSDEPKSNQGSPKAPIGNSESTTINPDIPAEGKPIDKDKLLNELRERDAKFSQHSVELERTWDTLTSARSEAAQYRHNSIRFGQADPGLPEGLPEDYQQPHRIRYIWTGQNFDSTLEILADLETAIHPEHGKLAARTIESDCFNYQRIWNLDQEIFSHSSDIAKLSGGKKAWEYLLPTGFGFTPSILSVSNAVEVDDGYVLNGLISLPSATIGNRKNCFEIHLDKEMILRKAVIQYHVYDFVIATSGRSEFAGMPPLAKQAAVSIHYIGQDEKRSGDVGNYKYEVISLSDRLSKTEYDLRVNFAIPKGTKLAAGLNLVEVNLQGLPGATQVERDQLAPRPEMTPREPDQAMSNPKPKRLQIREAAIVEADADSSQQSDESKVVEFSGIRLRLDSTRTAVLTEDDIMTVESVTVPNDPKGSQIRLTLRPEAGERFLIETTRLSSQPKPGYLVIEFDGTILSAPRVNNKISSEMAISFAGRDKLDMERVAAAIRESIATREKVAQKEPDARSVVEAYVASALAGDVAKAAALAKNSAADPKHIRELPEFLNVQRLKIDTVYVNDPAKPTRALATSEAVKLDEEHKNPDGRRDGFLVFTLEFTDDKWFVIDIDFETESGAEKELKKFVQSNPNSIGLPPTTRPEHGN